MSRPSRARGLKLGQGRRDRLPAVAPFTGAWIETARSRLSKPRKGVAPFTGAWIETWTTISCARSRTSRPSRARGLKRQTLRRLPLPQVAPFTGAWIETTWNNYR
mgnify:CR=1 FL=1